MKLLETTGHGVQRSVLSALMDSIVTAQIYPLEYWGRILCEWFWSFFIIVLDCKD